jgi:hypothetical protein
MSVNMCLGSRHMAEIAIDERLPEEHPQAEGKGRYPGNPAEFAAFEHECWKS